MDNYRRGSHTVYDIKYHLVWVTKYRYRVLTGDIGLRVRDLIRQVCMSHEVEIIKGHVASDHVHLFVSAPPSLAVSKLVQYSRATRRTGCRWNFRRCGSGTGGSTFGPAATSAPAAGR
jgi:putative transposase